MYAFDYQWFVRSRRNNALRALICEFVRRSDHYFIPPLSARTDLDVWLEKTLREAEALVCIDKDQVIGAVFVYATPKEFDYAFITYIAVDRAYGGRGVGSSLLQQVREACEHGGMSGIESQTWEQNLSSRLLFRKMGFREYDLKEDRPNGGRTVLLRLNFYESD